MRIDFTIAGSFTVPDGTEALPGLANQFRLPSGEIISVHPIIEKASNLTADDHRDLSYTEAERLGVALSLYDRDCELVSED
jgi:hypothetical protein